MKHLAPLIFTLFWLNIAKAQKIIDLEITDVTVFLNQAQVTRKGSVELTAGKTELLISGLTQGVNPQSVSVKGNDAYQILGVKMERRNDETLKLSSKYQVKQDSLDELQFDLQTNAATMSVYDEEMEFMRANRSIKGEEGLLLVEDVEEMADFWRERMREIQFRQLELRSNNDKIQVEIQKLQLELNKISANLRQSTNEVTITLDVKKPGNHLLEFSYVVHDAQWLPVYDLRTSGSNEDLYLTYKGRVKQNTGNDWDKVNMTLSSGNPAIGGDAPSFYNWYLSQYEKESSKSRHQTTNAPAFDSGGYEDEISTDATYADNKAEALVSIYQNVVNTEFKINIPYSVPSDNQYVEVENQVITLQSEYKHYAAPRSEESVFLLASVTDWIKYNLLPGDANIYFNRTFVGNSFIDPNQGSDTLDLSLGIDPSVVIKREQIQDFCKTKTIGGKKLTTKGFEISVMNNKKQSVTLEFVDQIPLSKNNSIEIETLDLSGGKLDEETGKITWEVTLVPGESISKVLKFSVKYPKKVIVGGL